MPHAGLIADMVGNLYGTTPEGGGTRHAGTVFELTPAAGGGWTKNVLYNFCILTPCSDGGIPLAGLIADSKGNLYGTTASAARQMPARCSSWRLPPGSSRPYLSPPSAPSC